MCGQGPPIRGLEHPILEDVRVGVRPVVGDLPTGHEAHDVGLECGSDVVSTLGRRSVAAPPVTATKDADEAAHRSPRDIGDGCGSVVGSALEQVGGGVIPAGHPVQDRVRDAVGGLAPPEVDPVGARIGAEVVIERAVLLNDEDEMVELEDPIGPGRRRRIALTGRSERRRQGDQEEWGRHGEHDRTGSHGAVESRKEAPHRCRSVDASMVEKGRWSLAPVGRHKDCRMGDAPPPSGGRSRSAVA
jgi:hypothetical protein